MGKYNTAPEDEQIVGKFPVVSSEDQFQTPLAVENLIPETMRLWLVPIPSHSEWFATFGKPHLQSRLHTGDFFFITSSPKKVA